MNKYVGLKEFKHQYGVLMRKQRKIDANAKKQSRAAKQRNARKKKSGH
jgi:hypothetical protein